MKYPSAVPQAFPGQRLARVALITGSLKLGGATTFLCTFGSELLKRGIETRIYCFESDNPLAADFKNAGLPVTTFDERSVIFEDRLRAVLRELGQFKPQVVLANISPASYEVLRYAPPGVFRVVIAHADEPNVYAAIKPYFDYTDLIGGVSETIRQRFAELTQGHNLAVKYLPLGVPMPETVPPRDFCEPLRILYIGRVEKPQKRVHLFPEILTSLERSGIPFHWTIAGDGRDRQWLEMTMRAGLKNGTLNFPGILPYAQVPEVLAKHDVFLLASDAEGLPLGLLEAMGTGMVPVITDLESGVRQVVDDSNGIRVGATDIAGYSAAIINLNGDRARMRKLSVAARERVFREFSPGAMADRWIQAFPPAYEEIAWPTASKIQPPLTAENNWRFTRWGTLARRLGIKLSKRNP